MNAKTPLTVAGVASRTAFFKSVTVGGYVISIVSLIPGAKGVIAWANGAQDASQWLLLAYGIAVVGIVALVLSLIELSRLNVSLATVRALSAEKKAIVVRLGAMAERARIIRDKLYGPNEHEMVFDFGPWLTDLTEFRGKELPEDARPFISLPVNRGNYVQLQIDEMLEKFIVESRRAIEYVNTAQS